MTGKDRAEKSAAALWAGDQASQWFGMALDHVDEGRATVSMAIQPHHCNGHGTCHGGVIFALADSAFAFACNSRNQVTVAQHNAVTYLRPGQAGDVLTATAQEVALQGRSGIYDVTVTNQDGQTVAEFRGGSRTLRGQLFKED